MTPSIPFVITEVHLTWINPVGGLIALARIVLNDALVLDSIGVHEKLSGGYRLTYPTKNGRYLFNPIAQVASSIIEKAINDEIRKQKQVVNCDDRYGCTDIAVRAIPNP